jgi:hypothetical protein
MTSTPVKTAGSSDPVCTPQPAARSGHFMLTLCPLAAPVSLRPPQSPKLKPFRFFMSRARDAGASEQLYLHMGFFATLADAERWAQSVRRHYPNAYATVAPAAFLRPATAEAPAPSAAAESLTDTQVLKILETRHAPAAPLDADARESAQIALLRPEDTGTRQALREAVVRGAAVSFAVQLEWSTQPIDRGRVPPLGVFRARTVYETESRRNGRARYFLRLGFFPDPMTAKQVAAQVRATFTGAAVIPVVEEEVLRAREAGRSTSAIPYLAEPREEAADDEVGATDGHMRSGLAGQIARRGLHSGKSAEQPTEPMADSRGMWTDADSLSESGVRHLRVEVQEHLSGRWKVIRLGARASEATDAYAT